MTIGIDPFQSVKETSKLSQMAANARDQKSGHGIAYICSAVISSGGKDDPIPHDTADFYYSTTPCYDDRRL